MKTFISLICSLTLIGCTPIPVRVDFPEPPNELTQLCPDLEKVQGNQVEITDFLTSVVKNYSLYHNCSLKVETWNKWYEEVKKIYNDK